MQTKVSKNICTGCGACFNICPKNAIEMKEDEEGFLFPVINKELCVNCNMCEKVCPAINHTEKYPAQQTVYAMKAGDKIRMKSSSGGVFSLLSDKVMEEGGFVCGAAFSDDFMKVEHIVISKKEDLFKLRNSKYIQSDTGKAYSQIKDLLTNGKKVLFSGTPCQVAGLKNFLGKDYENLLTVEVLCHGAPSPMVWREYLKEISDGRKIYDANFRFKKRYGLRYRILNLYIKYKESSVIKKVKESAYFKAFLQNLILRQCCFDCQYTTVERTADITLGDFWRLKKYKFYLDDGKGISLYIPNTDKGKQAITAIKKELKLNKEVPLKYAVNGNPILTASSVKHVKRDEFLKNINKGESMVKQIENALRVNNSYDGVIINFWKTIENYGAVLTAYALQQYLKSRGLDYRLLDFDSKKRGKKYKNSFAYKFAKDHLKTTHPVRKLSELKNVTSFVVGSDQVFRDTMMRKYNEFFLLSKTDFEARRIAFSASFGVDEFSANKDDLDVYTKLFRRFDAISTREDSGVDICRKNFGVDATHIIDPVFLADEAAYDVLIDKESSKYKDKIVCYVLDYDSEKRKRIEDFAILKNLEIINLAYSNVSAEEFLSAIYNAKYFFTDSFHGCCFSIIFHKNFKCFVNRKRGAARFSSLIRTFNLQSPFVEDISTMNLDDIEINSEKWSQVESAMQYERNKANEWFKKSFESPNIKTNLQLQNEISILKQKEVKFKNEVSRRGFWNMMFSVEKLGTLVVLRILGIKISFNLR